MSKTVKSTKTIANVDAIAAYRDALNSQIEKRIALQSAKYANEASKLANFMRSAKRFTDKLAKRNVIDTLYRCNIDTAFINTANYSNIYTAIKVADFAVFLSNADSEVNEVNHYSRRVFDTLLQCEARNVAFTRLEARAAISKSVVTSEAKQSAITTATNLDASTAQTQASSSLAMLLLFGAIRRDATSSARDEVFKVNRESEAAKILISKLAARA